MLSVTFRLDHIHCNQEEDNWFSSEPYLWTVFFYTDFNTITLGPGNIVGTFTPLASATCRGLYPGDVDEGDDVDIPTSLGVHTVILDDGGQGQAMAGVLFVLLEQDQTPGKAIKAGHQALADATDFVLNDFVNKKIQTLSLEQPTDAEIQAMADQIQGEVMEAVKDKLSWYHAFYDHDDVFGFGHQFFLFEQLQEIGLQTDPVFDFVTNIHHEKQTPDLTIINDYDVYGRVLIREVPDPVDACPEELEAYRMAVKALGELDKEILETKEELKSNSAERQANLAFLMHQRDILRPEAIEAMVATRAAYDDCRGRVSTRTTDYLAEKAQLRESRKNRLAGKPPILFRPRAVVAAAQPLNHQKSEKVVG